MKFLFGISIFLLVSFAFATESQIASVSWDFATGKFVIHDHYIRNPVATAVFTNEIFQTGWSYLEVKTTETFPDSVQAYAAGLVEGYLTKDIIRMHWSNTADTYCDGEESYCERLRKFLQDNLNYVNDNIATERSSSDYWHQVALILEQLQGIEDSYHNVTAYPRTTVNPMGLMMLNSFGDFMDLEVVLKRKVPTLPIGGGSCSVLVKVLPNNKDIYIAHDSWTTYNVMLRILKKYDLRVHVGMHKDEVVPGHISSFSSQPGFVISGDDFYLLSTGLDY